MSDGITIVRALLVADAPTVLIVPAARIGAGVLPQGTPLPWISLTLVSSVDRNIPAPGATRSVTDRIQVTVGAATYDEMRAALKAVKDACADMRPGSSWASGVVVLSAGRGPDFMDEAASIYFGSRDFTVTYNEVR